MTPETFSRASKAFSRLDPALLAASLVARDDGFAEGVFDPVQIDLDLVADLDVLVTAGAVEFLERDAPFRLQADIDDRHVFFDGDDDALDDGTFEGFVLAERFLKQGGEILATRMIAFYG